MHQAAQRQEVNEPDGLNELLWKLGVASSASLIHSLCVPHLCSGRDKVTINTAVL